MTERGAYLFSQLVRINWLSIPVLAIWILIEKGIVSCIIFLIIIFIIAFLGAKTYSLDSLRIRMQITKREVDEYLNKGQLPVSFADHYRVSIIYTILYPWLIAAFFLGWYKILIR